MDLVSTLLNTEDNDKILIISLHMFLYHVVYKMTKIDDFTSLKVFTV